MKRWIQLSLMLWIVSSAAAQAQSAQPWQKTLRAFDWKDSKLQPQPPGSELFSTNGVSVLKIENTNNAPLDVLLLTITNSSLIAKADTISFEMKYENAGIWYTNTETKPFGYSVGTKLYLPGRLARLLYIPPEAPGGDEITNILDYNLADKSNWKPYGFSTGPAGSPPTKLELKLYLPGNGPVYLRPIKLLGIENNFNGWWSPQQSGLIGGIGGSLIGCLGGLIGLLVSKGKARNFVLAAVKCFIGLGILLTIGGLVAVGFRQPYAVWYALLLPGVILILVFSLNMHSIQRRYDELEIRRMASIDAMRS